MAREQKQTTESTKTNDGYVKVASAWWMKKDNPQVYAYRPPETSLKAGEHNGKPLIPLGQKVVVGVEVGEDDRITVETEYRIPGWLKTRPTLFGLNILGS